MPIVTLPKERIEKACHDQDDRPVLTYVQIDLAKKRAVATNAIIATIVPLDDPVPDDETGTYLISSELIEIARQRQCSLINVSKESARCQNTHIDNYQGSFPDVDNRNIIPDTSDYELVAMLDASLLWRLAQALCTSTNFGIKIYAKPGELDAQIYVEPTSTRRAGYGVIMPMHIPDKEIEIKNLPPR